MIAVLFTALAIACGSSPSDSSSGTHGGGSSSGGGSSATDSSIGSSLGDGSGFTGNLFEDGSVGQDDGGTMLSGDGAVVLPDNFVPTEKGGYALGAPLSTDGLDGGGLVQSGGSQSCSLIVGIVRDFRSFGLEDGGDPDFENFHGTGATPGLVQTALGSDLKPVYGGECDNTSVVNPPCLFGQQMTTKANFDEWYRYAAGVNLPYLVYFEFVPNNGVYTFASNAYFPLDNAGFGNTGMLGHNFSFTTEVHLKFVYKGGETFSFTGDDDLWVFINGTRVIDLGGLHTPSTASVNLDTLGLTKGNQYPLDLFNAERHSVGSDFEVDTDLSFTSCGSVPPDVPK